MELERATLRRETELNVVELERATLGQGVRVVELERATLRPGSKSSGAREGYPSARE